MRPYLPMLTALLAIAGCNRDEQAIRTYQVPKEPAPASRSAGGDADDGVGRGAGESWRRWCTRG